MKHFFLGVFFLICAHLTVAQSIISFPKLSDFVPKEFSITNNIIPIAILDLNRVAISDKIPISYSMMHYKNDSSNFLIKNNFIDNYSFKIQKDGKFLPLFSLNALKLPNDWVFYLNKSLHKVDSIKSSFDLNTIIRFYKKPHWWQNDATPLSKDGLQMEFICQLELREIVGDDCMLYVFYDRKEKIVTQIYQRD